MATEATTRKLFTPQLTNDELQICLIGLMAIESLLVRPNNQEIRCQALCELVHAHSHFGSALDLSSLIYSLDLDRNQFAQVIDKLDPPEKYAAAEVSQP